jgi:hypothetical protein
LNLTLAAHSINAVVDQVCPHLVEFGA